MNGIWLGYLSFFITYKNEGSLKKESSWRIWNGDFDNFLGKISARKSKKCTFLYLKKCLYKYGMNIFPRFWKYNLSILQNFQFSVQEWFNMVNDTLQEAGVQSHCSFVFVQVYELNMCNNWYILITCRILLITYNI